MSSGGRCSWNWRNHIKEVLLKFVVAVADLMAQATAWCAFRNASSVLRSSDFSPSKESDDRTAPDDKAATGTSTLGRASRSSNSGAAQNNFLSKELGAVKEPSCDQGLVTTSENSCGNGI